MIAVRSFERLSNAPMTECDQQTEDNLKLALFFTVCSNLLRLSTERS